MYRVFIIYHCDSDDDIFSIRFHACYHLMIDTVSCIVVSDQKIFIFHKTRSPQYNGNKVSFFLQNKTGDKFREFIVPFFNKRMDILIQIFLSDTLILDAKVMMCVLVQSERKGNFRRYFYILSD